MTSKNSSLAKSVNNFAHELAQLKSNDIQKVSYRVINPPQTTKNNVVQKLIMFLMFLIMLGMGSMGMMLFSKNAPSSSEDLAALRPSGRTQASTVASTSTVKESNKQPAQPVQNTEPSYLPSPSVSQEVCEDPTVCEKSPSAGPQTRFEFSQSEQ